MDDTARLKAALAKRFGEEIEVPAGLDGLDELARIAAHGVCRDYDPGRPVDSALLRLICACALSAPSKSDLQQRDIVSVTDPGLRERIAAFLPHMPWVAAAPAFLVVCLDGGRLPRLAELRGKPFANDHLDLLFNATGDAAIALATLIRAAEAVGLGCCPISEIRNRVRDLDRWLGLPDRVVPFAGLCVGWPARPAPITPRLPLALTLHENRYREDRFAATVAAYDRRRESLLPFASQRDVESWGETQPYGWSEDKARQYARPQRADFGAHVRAKGFRLD